jgi:hypothetical protein
VLCCICLLCWLYQLGWLDRLDWLCLLWPAQLTKPGAQVAGAGGGVAGGARPQPAAMGVAGAVLGLGGRSAWLG